MNIEQVRSTKWSENVMIVDADYVDRVAFLLSVDFERRLERRIPKADLAQWLVCMALDGGLREGNHETQVVLIHDEAHDKMEHFAPSIYENELNNQAFKDAKLGEFAINCIKVEDHLKKEDIMLDLISIVISHEEVKRIMIVPDEDDDELYEQIRLSLRQVSDDKRITLFAMQPMSGGNFRQEILGYSLMNALGIKGEEIK